jgi:L-lactate dehydrogenase (cytochrome)
MVDGGFRRGSDIVKAIAMGADFVFLGRPFAYALAAASAPGVSHAIQLVAKEIDSTLGLLGLSSIEEVGQDCLLRVTECVTVTSIRSP